MSVAEAKAGLGEGWSIVLDDETFRGMSTVGGDVVHKDMDEELVFQLVKAHIETLDELKAKAPFAANVGYGNLDATATGMCGANPIVFSWMMIIVSIQHSMWRRWISRSATRRYFGLFMDIALVVAALAISLTYLIEIESVCLIDQFTGDRQRMMDEALVDAIAFAQEYGLPVPDSVEDPNCLNNAGIWLVLIMGVAVLIFLGYNIKVWGLPLVLVSLAIALYTIVTVLVWYFHGPDDINKYLMTKLGSSLSGNNYRCLHPGNCLFLLFVSIGGIPVTKARYRSGRCGYR
ncbi:MAG: hypothetical protein ACI8P9_002367 [Parasphingorhabdus sp.]|jgi:hypothetical protein